MTVELILIYYAVLLAGHTPDDAIHHIAEVLSSVHTHANAHKFVSVRGDALINPFPIARHHCLGEWV